LRVHPTNRRYFADATGSAVVLAGMHTWNNFQDPAPIELDYGGYLRVLRENGHNFIRLWSFENSQALDVVDHPSPVPLGPMAFARPGPGNANDGMSRFDVTRFNQGYFDRLRERVAAARAQGIYVSIMLFDGFTVGAKEQGGLPSNVWLSHPFHASNNVNGIDGDPDKDGNGWETHMLSVAAVTAAQEAYVKKVVDTVNDLDNVLFEISNESEPSSTAWQYHMIDVIHAYEAGKPYQHPVGMTSFYYLRFQPRYHTALMNSPADWVSPGRNTDVSGEDNLTNPAVADGRKVMVADTDHLCGVCSNPEMMWKTFTRGSSFIFMDVYEEQWLTGQRDPFTIRNMGYMVDYGRRMNLAAMTPQGGLSSTGYCLASAGAEYLVYAPSGGRFTVNLGAGAGKTFIVEWLNPENGTRSAGAALGGGGTVSVTAPFSGAAVLYLKAG
jgi:hypothetical protein